MAENMSLMRKRSLKAQAERMRAAKARTSTAPIEKPESCVSDSEALQESILMPAPAVWRTATGQRMRAERVTMSM